MIPEKIEPEPYRQDGLQVKVKTLQLELQSRFGEDFLDRIFDYSFRCALAESKKYELDSINDELSKKIAFSRLFRFRSEYALFETKDFIEGMVLRGFDDSHIKSYLFNRIDEVVVFE